MDCLEYFIMPREQFYIDQLKRHQEIVDHYQKITESYKNSLESIIDNQRNVIDQLKHKCELYEKYLSKK